MRRNLGHNGHRLVIILIPILLNDIPAVYASTDAEPEGNSSVDATVFTIFLNISSTWSIVLIFVDQNDGYTFCGCTLIFFQGYVRVTHQDHR